jgi:hypothetical protein
MGIKNQPPTKVSSCLQIVECNQKWRDLHPTDNINIRVCGACKKQVHNLRLKDILKWKHRDDACLYIDFAGLAKLYPHLLGKSYPFEPREVLGIAITTQPIKPVD